MSFALLHPEDQIVTTMARIYGDNMTTTSGGNVSVRDENAHVWITPARVDKGSLRRRDIVCIHPDGTREGAHPPSSENPFHVSIYAATRPSRHRPRASGCSCKLQHPGRSALDAFGRREVLEATAAAIIRAKTLGRVSPMSEAVIDELTTASGIT